MQDIDLAAQVRLTPGDAVALDAEAQLKRAQVQECTTSLAAAKLEAEASGLEALAMQLRGPPAAGLAELRPGRGGEVSPLPDPRMPVLIGEIARTVHSPPDMLEAEATMSRLALAREAGVLTEAVDTAESVGADGAMEQMLVHEITAAHGVSMRLMAAANAALCRHERERLQGNGGALVEANRSALAAARLMDSTIRGAAALDRMRNGGRQQVTVQHLVVADGGQAVVAGTIGPSGGSVPRKRHGRGRGPQ